MTKNYGVKLGDRPTDYRAGAKTGALPYIERMATGDWESVLPPEERQSNDGGDSMSCVTFAHLNGIESQEIHLDVTGGNHPEYSDRWIAKMGNTSREGAYLWQIAEAIRTYGLVKESSYPKPNAPWTWDEYHKAIPEPLLSQLKAEGQEWLTKWDVKYESVDFTKASLMKHLKMAPLTVVIPGHAILNFRTTTQLIHYFDTYAPHKKTTSSILAATKVVLYPKAQAVPNSHLLVDIKYLDSGKQVEKLLNALEQLGWKLSVKRSNLYVYDDEVADLVMRFKMAGPLAHSYWARKFEQYLNKGREVNARDREYINKLIK